MVMYLSRLENGRFKGSFHRENLGRITAGVAGMFQKAAAKSTITYGIECDETQRETFVDRELWVGVRLGGLTTTRRRSSSCSSGTRSSCLPTARWMCGSNMWALAPS